MDEEAILAAYRARDEAAIAETQQQYGSYLFATADRILGSREDAMECVNDAIFRAWNSIPPDSPHSLRAYLAKITRNLALDVYDRLHAKRRGGGSVDAALDELAECLPDRAQRPDDAAEQAALRACIGRFLATLSDENRRMFLQRYWYCCTVAEVAAQHGMGESRVKMRLLRMREQLKDWLTKEDWEI